jgi:hypothetical protein
MNMIPTTTGAARAVGEVLPELNGKLDGSSDARADPERQVVDLVFTPSRDTTKDEINALLKAAAEGPMKGVLAYDHEPLVSIGLQPLCPPARPSTASKPRSSTASWCACSAGTTTNGASPTACSTPPAQWRVDLPLIAGLTRDGP